MLRDAMDFARNAHIYFQTPSLRDEVFNFILEQINKSIEEDKIESTSFWLSVISNILDGVSEAARKDESLIKEAEKFFIKNIELIERVAAKSKGALSRHSSLYLLIKYLPILSKREKIPFIKEKIDTSILILHTLRYPEIYKEDPDRKEDLRAIKLAIIGIFRWDLSSNFINGWIREESLIKFINELSKDKKEPYQEIIDETINIGKKFFQEINALSSQEEKQNLLFILFKNSSLKALRLYTLREKMRDIIYHNIIDKKEDLREELNKRIDILFEGKIEPEFKIEIWELLMSNLGEELQFISDKKERFQTFPSGSSASFEPILLNIMKVNSSPSRS